MKIASCLLLLLLLTQSLWADDSRTDTWVEGRTLTKKVDFEARYQNGDPDVEFQDVADLYGIYNLLEYRRYAQDYDRYFRGRGRRLSGRADVDVAFGLAGIVWGQVERRSNRPPKPKPAKARFQLTIPEADLASESEELEVHFKIRNTGWHELRFDKLDSHIFLLDSEGLPIAPNWISPTLLESIRPGHMIEGAMTFPRLEATTEAKFAFENILGEQKEVTFRAQD